MKFVITSYANQEDIINAIKMVDASAVIVIDPKESEIDVLIEHIRSNSEKFTEGFVNAATIDAIIENKIEVGLEVTDQIRINYADIDPNEALCDLFRSDEQMSVATDRVFEAWQHEVCGNMLHEMDALLLIALFGLKPNQKVLDAFKLNLLTCEHFNEETQQAIFSNYDQFVNDTLNRKDFNGAFEFNIQEGFDS